MLLAMVGDLDYFSKAFKLPFWSNASNPCCLRKCSKLGPNTYMDKRPDAPWLQTLWTPSTWFGWGERPGSAFFSVALWLSILIVHFDYMHCKFLGSDQYLFGSILYLLTHHLMPDEDPKENLQALWGWILQWYEENQVLVSKRFRHLDKLTMYVKKKGPPKLRGKAIEIKNFGPVMLAVWQEFGKESEWYDQLCLILELNIQLDKTLDDYPVSQGFFKLPEAAAEEFVETAMTMAQLTKTVSQACKASGINAFSVTAKTHDLVHIAMLSKFIHPALTWCFGGEDYMRIVQRLIQSCLSGNNFWRSPIKATSHYRLAMHLKFSDCNP